MSINPLDWIKEGINYILYNFVYTLLYYLEAAVCKALDWMQQLMDVFTGVSKVTYKPESGQPYEEYLINIFFHNNCFLLLRNSGIRLLSLIRIHPISYRASRYKQLPSPYCSGACKTGPCKGES